MDKIHIHNLLNGVLNLLNSNTLGNTIDDPIKIKLTRANDYISTEYKILNLLSALSGFRWNCIEQTLHLTNGKKIDQLKIEIIGLNSDQMIIASYYFDITEPFDEFAGDVSEYLKVKQNKLSK